MVFGSSKILCEVYMELGEVIQRFARQVLDISLFSYRELGCYWLCFSSTLMVVLFFVPHIAAYTSLSTKV